MLVGLLTNKRP